MLPQPATPSILQRSSDQAVDSALYPHVIAFFGATPAWSKVLLVLLFDVFRCNTWVQPLHIAVPEAAKSKLHGWLPAMVRPLIVPDTR
jgi:hypothetical protein